MAILAACSYASVERDAPELGKHYLLTEDLVLTDTLTTVPGLGPSLRIAPFVMTRARLDRLRRIGTPSPEKELTERGVLLRGSPLQVVLMFIHREPAADIRTAEVQFADPATGEPTTAYATWEDVAPLLEEVAPELEP